MMIDATIGAKLKWMSSEHKDLNHHIVARFESRILCNISPNGAHSSQLFNKVWWDMNSTSHCSQLIHSKWHSWDCAEPELSPFNTSDLRSDTWSWCCLFVDVWTSGAKQSQIRGDTRDEYVRMKENLGSGRIIWGSCLWMMMMGC